MNTPTPRITPAMREWCRRLAHPKRCYWTKRKLSALDVSCFGSGSVIGPTYIMAGKIEDAGLIRWEERPAGHGDGGTEWFAVLTDKGLAIAGAPHG